jgi:hypothetical protein
MWAGPRHIYKKGDRTNDTVVNIQNYQLNKKFYPTFFLQGKFYMETKLLGTINNNSDATDLMPWTL